MQACTVTHNRHFLEHIVFRLQFPLRIRNPLLDGV